MFIIKLLCYAFLSIYVLNFFLNLWAEYYLFGSNANYRRAFLHLISFPEFGIAIASLLILLNF